MNYVANRAQNSLAQIDVRLKRRWDLVPNLVESVKAYALHEKQVLESVTKARDIVSGAGNFAERSRSENMLSNSLKNLFAAAEAYPQLQANAIFLYVLLALLRLSGFMSWPFRARRVIIIKTLRFKQQ